MLTFVDVSEVHDDQVRHYELYLPIVPRRHSKACRTLLLGVSNRVEGLRWGLLFKVPQG